MLRATAFALIASLSLAVAATAHAAELYTVPLVLASRQLIICSITNVSTRVRPVEIHVLDISGTVVAQSAKFDLPPGITGDLPDGFAGTGRYCRFVVEGGKNSYRAGANVGMDGVGFIAAVPAPAGPVRAAELYTMPVVLIFGQHIFCNITNVSTKKRRVEVHILDSVGTVVRSEEFALAPGTTAQLPETTGAGRRCRFVVQGGKKSYRAGVNVIDSTFGFIGALPAE